MKSILLHINDDLGQESRLQAALALARVGNGHLRCVQVTPFSVFLVGDPTSFVVTPSLIKEIDRRAQDYRAKIEARLADEDVTWDWHYSSGDIAATIISESQLCDLIILSRAAHMPRHLEPLPLVGDVALHARVPVLAVPPEDRRFAPDGPVVVAWKQSPEAATALRASLPLLKLSAAVHVVTVVEDTEPFPTTDVCRYLGYHGIKAELHERHRQDKHVQQVLLEAAEQLDAACIVMGAYGHSRAREFIFGGMTRGMLEESPVPLFLSH